MAKCVSHAYRPSSNAESRRAEIETLRQGFPLILRNLDRILKTPRFFFCQLESAYIWTLWIYGGGGPIPLGVLAHLWQKGKMIYDCPECGGRFHAVGAGGSFGGGSVWGLCTDCGDAGTFSPATWHHGLHAVGPLLPSTKTCRSSSTGSGHASTGSTAWWARRHRTGYSSQPSNR